MKPRLPALLWILILVLAGLALAGARQQLASESGWREFHGTWTLSGNRRELPVEGGSTAAVVDVSGVLALANGEGLSSAFRAQAIGYDNGRGASFGRSTWTDESEDRVYSRLEGEPFATGKRIRGVITGGTGRYAGLAGEFEVVWQYVVSDEPGRLQGRAIEVSGRVRRAESRP